MAKGKAKTPEAEVARRQKISEARKRRKQELGYINSQEARDKIGAAARGRKLSGEHKEKIAQAHRGKRPKNFEEMQRKGWATEKPKEDAHPSWRGDSVKYSGLHAWVRKHKGTPRKCEECGTTEAKQFEWANISGKYHRDLDDYRRLCTSCHRKEGYKRGEYVTWNKGKKVQTNTGRTHFKPKTRIEVRETP